MKKIICFTLVLMFTCLGCTPALADIEEMSYSLINDVNFILSYTFDLKNPPYTDGGNLNGIGMNFGNDDSSLVALLLPDDTGEAISTGIILCTDEDAISHAVYTVCSMALLAPGMIEDGQAAADWFDECYSDILATWQADIDPASAEDPVSGHFEGTCGLSLDWTVLHLEDGPRFDIYFYLDPALNYVSPFAALTDAE